jgi:hypothetical protein
LFALVAIGAIKVLLLELGEFLLEKSLHTEFYISRRDKKGASSGTGTYRLSNE